MLLRTFNLLTQTLNASLSTLKQLQFLLILSACGNAAGGQFDRHRTKVGKLINQANIEPQTASQIQPLLSS